MPAETRTMSPDFRSSAGTPVRITRRFSRRARKFPQPVVYPVTAKRARWDQSSILVYGPAAREPIDLHAKDHDVRVFMPRDLGGRRQPPAAALQEQLFGAAPRLGFLRALVNLLVPPYIWQTFEPAHPAARKWASGFSRKM